MHTPVYRKPRGTITLRHYLLAIFALLILPGCNDDLLEPGTDCMTVSDGPADLATLDTSATPRADPGAEILALEVSGEFIAPEGLYQRVHAELTGVRATFPDVAQIDVRPCHDPGSVIVAFTEEGFQQVQDGTYTAWDDINANLRLTELEVLPSVLLPGGGFALRFEGRYNANRLAQGYSELTEITSARPDGLVGDGSDICLAPRLQIHFYIFREAAGDCPSGCIEESFLGVTVDDSGNISKVGEWDGSGDPPQWFAEALDCRAFL